MLEQALDKFYAIQTDHSSTICSSKRLCLSLEFEENMATMELSSEFDNGCHLILIYTDLKNVLKRCLICVEIGPCFKTY